MADSRRGRLALQLAILCDREQDRLHDPYAYPPVRFDSLDEATREQHAHLGTLGARFYEIAKASGYDGGTDRAFGRERAAKAVIADREEGRELAVAVLGDGTRETLRRSLLPVGTGRAWRYVMRLGSELFVLPEGTTKDEALARWSRRHAPRRRVA